MLSMKFHQLNTSLFFIFNKKGIILSKKGKNLLKLLSFFSLILDNKFPLSYNSMWRYMGFFSPKR